MEAQAHFLARPRNVTTQLRHAGISSVWGPSCQGVMPGSHAVVAVFRLVEGKGTRRDFALACPIALAAATACQVLLNRWFSSHFAVRPDFSNAAWDATIEKAKVYTPLWLACWVQCPDRSRRSSSEKFQNIWNP